MNNQKVVRLEQEEDCQGSISPIRRKEWKYVPVELNGMKEALNEKLSEVVSDYDAEGNRYELKIPISWKTIKAIHKAIIAASPNPPGPSFREITPNDIAPDKLTEAAEKAFALLEQLGEELHFTPASLKIIGNLGAALNE